MIFPGTIQYSSETMIQTDKILSDDSEIVEGEIVKPQATSTGDSAASVILNLETLIKSHITRIDNLKIESKKHKEMFDDVLNNDETYKLHDKKAKEAAKTKSQTKFQIMKRPDVATLDKKVKQSKSEVKELEAALSDYLKEYERLSGSAEIQTDDGEVREIVYTAKLVKKSTYNK